MTLASKSFNPRPIIRKIAEKCVFCAENLYKAILIILSLYGIKIKDINQYERNVS